MRGEGQAAARATVRRWAQPQGTAREFRTAEMPQGTWQAGSRRRDRGMQHLLGRLCGGRSAGRKLSFHPRLRTLYILMASRNRLPSRFMRSWLAASLSCSSSRLPPAARSCSAIFFSNFFTFLASSCRVRCRNGADYGWRRRGLLATARRILRFKPWVGGGCSARLGGMPPLLLVSSPWADRASLPHLGRQQLRHLLLRQVALGPQPPLQRRPRLRRLLARADLQGLRPGLEVGDGGRVPGGGMSEARRVGDNIQHA